MSKILNFNIKNITKCDFQASVENPDVGVLNKIRRIILSDIETFAIHDVVFQKNTSLMACELISHRIGLIPIQILDTSILKDQNLKISFKLHVKAVDKDRYVKYGDIDIEHPKLKILHDNGILVKLRAGEEINITGTVIKGTGKEHAKWTPVSVVYFKKLDNKEQYTFAFEGIGTLDLLYILKTAIGKLPQQQQININ